MPLKPTFHLRASSALTRYVVAAGFVALAGLLNSLSALQTVPFLFFFGAVALSARFCGFWPAMFASVSSALVVDYFFLEQRVGWSYDTPDLVRLACFLAVCGVISSVAKQQSALERDVEENRNRLAALVQSSEDAILSKTLEGTITSWNRAAEKLYGYTAAEVIGKNVSILTPHDRPEEIPDIMAKLARGERIEHFETKRRKKDGSIVDVFVSISPITGPGGEILGASAIARDVTQQNVVSRELSRTKEEAQDARQYAEEILASIAEGFMILDPTWKFAYVNQRAASLFEVPREKMLAANIWELFPDLRGTVFEREYLRAQRDRVNVRFEEYYPRLNKWFQVGAYPSVNGLSVFFQDVTERRLAEDTLRRTEKLAATGRLAATVAHEINNPLESITNLLYLVRKNPSLDEKALRHLTLADEELSRVAHIAKQTLGFYRDTSGPVKVNVPQTVDQILTLYARKLESSRVEVEREYGGEVEIEALAGELRQVLSNLIVNAIDAMPGGGRLLVRTAPARNWSNGMVPGVRISIADTGAGIQSAQIRRIFEPFFTTKKEVGTGLGLWVSRTIVEKHGGSIQVKSRNGRGTVFSIFMPGKMPSAEKKNLS